MASTIVAPLNPRGPWFEQTRISTIRKFPCKFELFWLDSSWEEEFYRFFLYKHLSNMVSPIVAPPDPQGHHLNKLESALCQEVSM
jgi:hypothetical protein